MPSQPPDPYQRQFSFTGWSLTHPGEPHQGDKIDLELNEVKQSMDQTQARLALIQTDDGNIRASALSAGLDEVAQELAIKAAEQTYADNLASVASKAAARSNLQLNQYLAALDGNNVIGWGSGLVNLDAPISYLQHFPASTAAPQPGQYHFGESLGGMEDNEVALLGATWNYWAPVGTFSSRRFRAAAMCGTLYDYATWDRVSTSVIPELAPRMDNISSAVGWAGTLGYTGMAPGSASMSNWFSADYTKLNMLPSIENPLASILQVADAIETHKAQYNHELLPSEEQKNALNGASSPSSSNPLVTMADLEAAGLTLDQAAAINAADSPSTTNPFVTQSVLMAEINGLDTSVSTSLAGKADTSHTHAIADVTGLQDELDGKASSTDSGIAKAWVTFDGSTTTPTIKASHNVTGVTRNSTGVYTITFASGIFANADYCWLGSGRNPGSNHGLIVSQDSSSNTQTSTTLQVTSQGDDGSAQDATLVNVVVYA